MLKPSVLILAILVVYPIYGYSITIQEKLIGILNKTTVINNIVSFEIDNNYVHVEIGEKGKFYPYSFACNSVVRITEDSGENIPFNCDEHKDDKSKQIEGPSIEDSQDIDASEFNRGKHFADMEQLQDAIINLGDLHRSDLTKRNINIENNVVIIEVNCRRTNLQSTLIKSYWLCGYAMYQNNLFFPEIRVILNIQKKEKEKLITSANGKDVIELGQHKIPEHSSLSNFLNKIDVYRPM